MPKKKKKKKLYVAAVFEVDQELADRFEDVEDLVDWHLGEFIKRGDKDLDPEGTKYLFASYTRKVNQLMLMAHHFNLQEEQDIE